MPGSLLLLLFGWHSGDYRVCAHFVSRSFLALSAAVLSALTLQVAPALAQPAPGAAATNPASLDLLAAGFNVSASAGLYELANRYLRRALTLAPDDAWLRGLTNAKL